jgi:hypothetical protein
LWPETQALPDVEINFRERVDTHNRNHDQELKLRGTAAATAHHTPNRSITV